MHRVGLWRVWVLVLALSACASIGGAPVDELGELATMGSSRPLREPMNPIRGTTRVLVLALDGVGRDELLLALREERLASLSAMMGGGAGGAEHTFAHGYLAPDVVSILPSATTPAWVSIFTGEPPARTGVLGNEWFVREERKFYAPVPVTVSRRSHALKMYTDELMSDLLRVPTVYEGLPVRVHVSLHPVFRGADLLTVPEIGTFGDLFRETVKSAAGGGPEGNPTVYRETDESAVRSLAEAVEEFGLPDLQVAYLPGTDLYTHVVADPLAAQQRYLAEVVDPAIARILDLYRARGALDSTYVLLVSDHGHTPVMADDRHSLWLGGDDEPTAAIEQAGFRLRPPTLSSDPEDYQAVVAYQGGMAYVYLADRSTCEDPGQQCDWQRPPRLQEDVLAVARALYRASATGEGVPALRGTLDLVLARDPRPTGEDALPFQVFDGERLVPVAEYLRRNPRPELIGLERRLRGLAAGPYGHRAGDVLLLSRFGMDRPLDERFYFAGPYQSEHGSAHPQDSRVPLLLIHPRRSGAQLRELVRGALGAEPSQLDVAPLLRALLRPER